MGGASRRRGSLHSRPFMTSRAHSSTRRGSPRASSRPRRAGWRTAATSDRHELYEASVQSPESEVDFIDQAFRRWRGRTARSFREDFAGTMYLSTTWIRRRADNTAIAVDLDPSVQAWGMRRHVESLTDPQRARLDVRLADVRTVRCPKVDCIGAFNFSFYLFHARQDLVAYFRTVRRGLKRDGLFILDAYGGSDALVEQEEVRDLDGFTYVWETERYDPITGRIRMAIHFRFPDRTERRRAFVYDWRLWTLPELRECLQDAGFREVEICWEGSLPDGSGNGIFRPARRGEACLGWIAYLVAVP